MSRDAKMAVLGTAAFMIWSVISALSVDHPILRVVLAGTGVLLPVAAWTVAARAEKDRRDRMLIWVFSAEFVVMVCIDAFRWSVAAP